MTSISLQLNGEILYVKFEQTAQTPTIIQDTWYQLNQMIEGGHLPGGPFIGVNGASTLVSGYAISQVLGERYGTVSVYDPKFDGYVVVIASTALYQVGEVIHFNSTDEYHPLKIVLCGPPHVGKSCLREGLKQVLMAHYQQQRSPYPYVLSACPDGEGAWFAVTHERTPALAGQLKSKYRTPFTPEFTQLMAQSVAQLKIPLSLIDIGGMPSPENRLIAAGATHAIILWREPFTAPSDPQSYSSLQDWLTFCQCTGLDVIAILKSQRQPNSEPLQREGATLKGTIYGLNRGQDCSHHPVIQALAETIRQRCSSL